MATEAEIYDLIVIVYGFLSVLLLFILMNFEAYKKAKQFSKKYRNFMLAMLRTAIIVDAIGIIYFSLRIHQWTLGFHNYIFADFLMVLFTTSLYVLTHPFFVDKLKEIEMFFGTSSRSGKN
jgi:biotin transporter BioY